MTDRQRLRRGRTVSYNPTAAEIASFGAGPYLAVITAANADGTADLLVDIPSSAQLGTITTADAGGSYTSAEQDLINELKDDLNLLIGEVNATRKVSAPKGSQAGQFSFDQTGPQAL